MRFLSWFLCLFTTCCVISSDAVFREAASAPCVVVARPNPPSGFLSQAMPAYAAALRRAARERLSRRLLLTTVTELSAMAAAAKIGVITPNAASGMRITL